ncbi:MAG: hypothetical protein BGO76_08520 [Caedibacter sp. 38-128]|nr:SagB/ThcOx family dehydrogenase [Holosporales bacterium]OJX06513.1 MAG: hypothetical protein BGO76_08520 [Caedibacter sp. 38-128]
MTKLYISPYIFFLLKEGRTIVWNYKNHTQFELEEKYFNRLKELSCSGKIIIPETEEVDKDLIEANLVSLQPYEPFEWKWDELGQIYHVGTQDVHGGKEYSDEEFVSNYYEFCKEVTNQDEYQYVSYNGDQVTLPKPNIDKLDHSSVLNAIKLRMTSRSFNGEKVSIENFSTLLFANFGLLHGEWEELKQKNLKNLGIRRAHPSGGGLHPVEAYVLVFNVENIPAGIYHYNVKGHYLSKIAESCSYEKLKHTLCGQFFGDGISFGIFLVGHFDKVWDKYGHSRSYKDVYLDAGHVSQTFLLTATALELLTWETAWFKDSEVSSLLNINGISVAPLFFLGAGYGQRVSVPPKLHKLLQQTS